MVRMLQAASHLTMLSRLLCGLRHCERSEAIRRAKRLDCFVAGAPRNDARSIYRRLPLLILLAPAACGQLASNPLDQPGTWKPTGANDLNLRAMIADPADLAGRPVLATSPAALPVRAMDRMLADKVKPLTTTSSSAIYGSSAGGGGGSGNGGQ